MKNILVPVDFSHNSKVVFHYALEIANRMDGKITLLSVVHGIPIQQGNVTAFRENLEKAILLHKSRLASFREKYQIDSFAHIEVDELVVDNFPGEGILSTAKSIDADLLVMGIRNKSNWSDFFFGSVARFVLDRAVCDTLTIPPDYNYNPFKNLLYFVHSGLEDLKNLEFVKHWVNAWLAILHGVFISNEGGEEKELKAHEKNLATLFEDIPLSEVHILENNHHFQKQIENFLKLNDISLIATKHHDELFKKLLHTRNEINLSRNLHVPILFFVNDKK